MKFCIDCKHNERELWCKSPANGVSPITGTAQLAFSGVNRGTSVLAKCGPDAVNFEPKATPHVAIRVSASGFLHTVYQYFGKKQ